MKKFLVLALAVVMAICSLTMTGCSLLEKIGIGKEGVSFEEFNEKAQALKANDPVLTKGKAYFKFGTETEFGADIDFVFTEEGDITYSKHNLQWYAESAWQVMDNTLHNALEYYCLVWNTTEVEEKNEKTDSGNQFKTTVVYQTENEFSIKIVDYMKTAKGNEAESVSLKKYDATTGYLVEYYTKSNSGTIVTLKLDWATE